MLGDQLASRKKKDKHGDATNRSQRKGKKQARKRRKPAKGRKALVDQNLMQALSNPLRVEILALLLERVASPKEIADELDKRLPSVSYHVGVLSDFGVIVQDHTIPRRGAVEHFYRPTESVLIPPDAWDNVPPAMRKAVSMCILEEFFNDAAASLEAGIFDESGELSWTPLILDKLGLKEVENLSLEFVESVLKVQAKANERLPNAKDKIAKDAVSATIFLANFLSVRSPEEGKKASSTRRRRGKRTAAAAKRRL
jgi:DNA-binding transcriptional ArsR family regulator